MMRTVLTLVCFVVPVLAVAQGRGPLVKRTNPSTLSKPTGYTHVVEVSGPTKTVYVSGQVALDQRGNVVGAGDMKAQAEQVFRNLQAALAAAGARFTDVVKMNTYTTNMAQMQAVRDVRARYFGDVTPASTLVQVAHLARPEFMLEVEVTAVIAASAVVVPAQSR